MTARDADYVPSKQATLESIDYLWRLLGPLSNDTVREHLLGVRRFVSHAHNDGPVSV